MAEDIGKLRVSLSLDGDDFNKSMASVERNIKATSQEMSIIRAKGDEWGRSAEGLSVKQETLTRLMNAQELKVKKLNEQYKNAVKEQGENSKGAEDLAIKLNKATAEYTRSEKELKDVNSALEKTADEFKKMEQEVKGASDALSNQNSNLDNNSKKWDGLSTSISNMGDRLEKVGTKAQDVGGQLSMKLTAPIVAGFALATKGTQELAGDLAKLETNAKNAGIGANEISGELVRLSGISTETDSNVEALSNLIATGFKGNELTKAVDLLSGAVVKFPDTLKIEGLADGLQETLATGKAIGPFAELLERSGVNLEEFDEGLKKAAKSGDEQNYVLQRLSKLGLGEVNKSYREQNKNLVKANETQAELQNQLVELGDELRPIATDIAEFGVKAVKAFNDLEPEVQKNVIAAVGLAAAAGPVISGFGSLAVGASGVAKVVSPLIKLIGTGGLVTSFAGLLNPIGLTVAAVAGLTAVVGISVASYKKQNEVNIEALDAKQKEIEKTDQLIARYEELQSSNMLSNDEMLRFLDIQEQLKETSSVDKVAELKDEQNKLLEKSTLTNDQMNEFIGLNQDIIEMAPDTKRAISEEGIAFAENTTALKDLNAEKAKQLQADAYEQVITSLQNEKNLYQEQKDLIAEINSINSERQTTQTGIRDLNTEINEQSAILLNLENQKKDATGLEILNLDSQIQKHNQIKSDLQVQLESEKDKILTLNDQESKRQDLLDSNREEIALAEAARFKYEEIILAQAGITSEKGRGLEAIATELSKLDQQKKKLQESLQSGKLNTDEYNNQNAKIDTQIGKLKNAKRELELVNDVAGQAVYKNVNVKVSPSVADLNRQLGAPLTRYVSIITNKGPVAAYATGTKSAPGGMAWVGEEGPELMYVPSGSRIIPNEESMKILENWNVPTQPRLNGGASQAKTIKLEMVIEAPTYLDGRELGRGISKYVKEFNTIDERIIEVMGGG